MILMRLVCRESSRVNMCELGPFPNPREFRDYTDLVSYVTPDWSFSSGVRNLFVFRAYPTMRVRLCLLYMVSVFEYGSSLS